MSKRFLIGQLGRFGDCLYATTIARQIKNDFPASHITWAIDTKYKSILELNPHVDKIWEVFISNEDYYDKGWRDFKSEALERQSQGEFDEIIFSQINPDNLINYNGTIRSTTLSSYKRPITVSVDPVIRLTETEIKNVKNFADEYHLHNFKNVILFECAPGSSQSKLNLDFALNIAESITKNDPTVCFLLTTPQKLEIENPQIVDASSLSFRENAEITKYCSLLIGCSSGISWLSTSDWAKKLPTMQLLDKNYNLFAGMHYDFAINGLDNSHIIEMTDFNKEQIINCVRAVLKSSVELSKVRFHQPYKPTYFNLQEMVKFFILRGDSFSSIKNFIRNYVRENKKLGNKISKKYILLYLQSYYYETNIPLTTRLNIELRRYIKKIIYPKSAK